MATQTLDILAIGAHPDDVEVGAGGVIIDQADRGRKCGLVVLTRGEMSTGGTPEIRAEEVRTAARVLGASVEAHFDWGDTRLEDSYEHRLELAEVIRRTKPRLILAPYPVVGHGRRQSHADHVAAGVITINAANLASLAKADIPGEPHLAGRVLHYFLPPGVTPNMVVDITHVYDRWMTALSAHQSQFLNPEKSKDYLDSLNTMARTFGGLARCKYGQGFYAIETVRIRDIMSVVEE